MRKSHGVRTDGAFAPAAQPPPLSPIKLISSMTTSSSILLACRQIELSFFNNEHTVDLARHFLARGALHDSAFLQVGSPHGCDTPAWCPCVNVHVRGEGCAASRLGAD
jgi:hypothetical protein